MKIPLRFQITEFDCGTIALQNAITYLYDRENVPPELIRAITIYTINCYDERGNMTEEGNTYEAVENMTSWIYNFLSKYSFGLICKRYTGANIDFTEVKKCVDNKGCCLYRTTRNGVEHYVIMTMADDEFVYLWDGYYLGETYYDNERKISIVYNKPFYYNRKVAVDRFFDQRDKDFSLGKVEERDILLFNRMF